jgi:hypothetical protein
MLIDALQGRDELNEMKRRMSEGATTLHRRKSNLSWPAKSPTELRPVAEQIWKLLAGGPVTLSSLFRQCCFCELKIYEAIDELVESQHLDLSRADADQKVA